MLELVQCVAGHPPETHLRLESQRINEVRTQQQYSKKKLQKTNFGLIMQDTLLVLRHSCCKILGQLVVIICWLLFHRLWKPWRWRLSWVSWNLMLRNLFHFILGLRVGFFGGWITWGLWYQWSFWWICAFWHCRWHWLCCHSLHSFWWTHWVWWLGAIPLLLCGPPTGPLARVPKIRILWGPLVRHGGLDHQFGPLLAARKKH